MGSFFKPRFELIKDAPPAWGWEQYDRWLSAAYRAVLDSPDAGEPALQRFLEQHPSLIPGGEGSGESIGGHHGSFPEVVFSQAELPGLKRPIPDFLWMSKVSGEVWPVVIEIKDPRKPWFRSSDGVQHAELTQALDQLAKCRQWFGQEAHRELFYRRYGISDWVREYHKISPIFCLIYGRRQQFEHDAALSQKRAETRPDWLVWMTYDRLRPSYSLRHAVAVRQVGGRFEAIAIPPTFHLGPRIVRGLRSIHGVEEAIARNELISEERREFLLARWPYWLEVIETEKGRYWDHGDHE